MNFINFISKLIIILLVCFWDGIKETYTEKRRETTIRTNENEKESEKVATDTHTLIIFSSPPLLSRFGKLTNL